MASRWHDWPIAIDYAAVACGTRIFVNESTKSNPLSLRYNRNVRNATFKRDGWGSLKAQLHLFGLPLPAIPIEPILATLVTVRSFQ